MNFQQTNKPIDAKNSSFGRPQGNQYTPAGPMYYNSANQEKGTNRKSRIPGGGRYFPLVTNANTYRILN